MVQTQINGGSQIRSGTITTTQLAASAGITDGQLASSYLYADGTRALTGNLQGGAHEATNFATPTAGSSLATKGYVDSIAQGLANKYSAHAATNTETLTIAAGSVTTIAGTTVDGVTVAVNDYVLIPNAPAATGAAGGTTLSSQPANGLYQVTAVGANLTVARANDMSGTNSPYGSYCFVIGGGTWGGAGFVVTTPSTPAAFTYGTGNIGFVQFSGAGEITTDGTIVKAGNQLTRAAITGDVAISAGSNASTIGAGVVSFAKMANLAANSVIGNSTGSAATPTAVPMSSALAASTIPMWDANKNLAANNTLRSVTSTATAAGTTTLAVGSTYFQQFTGGTTQTVVMPNATTLQNGHAFCITNRSTGVVTVNMNGGSLLQTMQPGSQLIATLMNNGTAAGTWDLDYTTSGNAATAPSAGIVKSNGSVLQTAVAGTDYMAPSDFAFRETPAGTINGSNTVFTLANTPLSGTEEVYVNGILQDPGGTNDYTISGAVITFVQAPTGGATPDKIRVSYQK